MPVLQLPDKTVKLIRSTQVITSISSTVKELLENAIDAGATSVDIKLERYGLDRIQVEDNGSGINSSDIKYVCLPHYTSKIYSFQDLQNLQSYGFRGEALNSLCAISNVRITSKTKDEQYGSCYTFDHNGNVISEQPSARQNGTTVCITDIFKNVPVRRQLYQNQKAANELRNLEKVVKSISFIIPKIRVFLYHNKCLIWQKTSCETLLESIAQLYPSMLVKHLNYVSLCNEQVSVEMLLPARQCDITSIARSSYNAIMFYVNKRPVNDQRINKMVKEEMSFAFPGKLLNKCPVCVISISVKSDEVDFNLEPDKTRVLIKDFDNVINCIRETIALHLNEDLYEKPFDEKVISKCSSNFVLSSELIDVENPIALPNPQSNTVIPDPNIAPKEDVANGDMDLDEFFDEVTKEMNEENLSILFDKDVIAPRECNEDNTASTKLPLSDPIVPKDNITAYTNQTQIVKDNIVITKPTQPNFLIPTDNEDKENSNVIPPSNITQNRSTVRISQWSRGIVSTDTVKSQHKNGSFVIGPKISSQKGFTSKHLKPNSIDNYAEIKNTSISSQMGRKELSGFTKFARDIKSEIMRESPGISFTKVASRLAEGWKSLNQPQKENYIEIAGKKDNEPKKSLPIHANIKKFTKTTVTLKTSLNDINRSIHKPRLQNLFECRLIKEIGWNGQSAWLCYKGNELGVINIHRLNELVVYHRNLLNMTLPLDDCTGICLTKRDVGDGLWRNLLSLQRNELSIITDKAIISNGFNLQLIQDNACNVLHCYDQQFTLEHIKQLLQFIANIENETECRPPFAIQYIKEETMRMCKEKPVSSEEIIITSLVRYWEQCTPTSNLCLHDKPIFMTFTD